MLLHAIALSLIAGPAITAGAWLASIKLFHSVWLQQEFRHGITAFGGGALISAVAFVLIPDGADKQGGASTILTFIAGGIFFMIIDRLLARSGSRVAQFMAMMLDFVPEAIVVGAVIAGDLSKAIFITLVIAAQNLPEGYAAYTEMHREKSSKNTLWMFLRCGHQWAPIRLIGIRSFCASPNHIRYDDDILRGRNSVSGI